MYKEKVYSLLLSLLCLMISTAVWAQDYVTPTLVSDDEVSIFLMTSEPNSDYHFYGYGGDYNDPQHTAYSDGDDQFVYQGAVEAGSYLYKWTRPSRATGVPTGFIISKGGTTDADKEYDNSFVNHGIYMQTTKIGAVHYKVTQNGTITAVAKNDGTDPLAVLKSEDEHSLFFETTEQDSYKMWPYGGFDDPDGKIGGLHYCTNNYPGDLLTYVGKLDNGHYLYKWTQGKNTTDAPTNFIITNGLGVKISTNDAGGDAAFINHGYYNCVITHDPNTTTFQQFGKVYSNTASSSTSTLDSSVHLESADEISLFLESPNDATYYIWPYTDVYGGEHFTKNAAYPGEVMTKQNVTLKNGHYLYKWTFPKDRVTDMHLYTAPTRFIISTGAGDDNKITERDFTNHGYYVLTENNGTPSIDYTDEVTRLADGTYTTTESRTTVGKRVIYEMNIGAFAGNLQNATKQLNFLKNLGVDVIWLMPVYNHKEGGSPYAVTNYSEMYPKYGTKEDLKAFVSAAHDLNMDVWLDFVPNHTSTDNVWVTEHPEYYAKGADGNMVHPTSGTTTYKDVYQLDLTTETTDATTGEVYVPAARALRNVMADWVKETDVDGFRMDMASSSTIPSVFWTALTNYLKTIKPSLQFLAEADFSRDHQVPQSSLNYDYAWDFNDRLRAFGESTLTWADNSNLQDLAGITNYFVKQTNGYTQGENIVQGIQSGRMVYLTNHDINKDAAKKTMAEIYGTNRYAMTVYEFTMPGMPLIYNGQEQNGSVSVDFYKDDQINWTGTRDNVMLGLIQELAQLKHTNNALNDGNTSDQRGSLNILNSDDNTVLAYERIKGDKHVMVVLNLSAAEKTPQILGASTGTWKRVLSGSNYGLDNHNDDVEIGEVWKMTNYPVPAHGYEIFTFTGPRNNTPASYYFVTDDSWDNVIKHPMVAGNDNNDFHTAKMIIDKKDFKTLANSQNATSLTFKIQEYYTFEDRTVCKNPDMFGSKGVENPVFDSKDGNKEFSSTTDNAGSSDYKFTINYDDDVERYIVTFYRGISKSTNCKVGIEYFKNGTVLDGYYLETAVNINGKDTETHQWRFNYQSEDPESVNDNWLTKINKDEKYDLCSYVINSEDFDKYIPAERRSSQTIQFRIRLHDNGNDVINTDLDATKPADICPSDDDYDNAGSTFDASKESNKVYSDAHWEPFPYKNKEKYFKLVYQPDVAKYIIQVWKTSASSDGSTRVRVYYVRKFNYPGSTIEDVTASNEDVYLYNVDAQKFLYVGNAWGTMASLLYDDLGTRLNISEGVTSENPDYKLIRTRFENNTTVPNGHMLGIDDWSYNATSASAFDRLDSANIFCDRDNGDRWIFEKVDTVSYANTYLLRLYNVRDHRFHFMIGAHGNADANENTKVYYIAQQDTRVRARDLTANELQNGAERRYGDFVNNLGTNKGHILYDYTAPKAGTYEISVRYITDQNKWLSIKVGDETQKKASPSTYSNININTAQTLTYRFHMNSGTNEIDFANQEEQSPRIVEFTISMVRPDDLSYARWQLVTYHDLLEKLKSENADLYGGTSADATFLLKDQGFTRYIQGTWDTDKGSAVNYTIKDEQGNTTTDNFTSTVTCTKNTIGDRSDYGMYWNGRIQGHGIVYQDVDVPMYGVYEFDAYGFCHGSKTKMFYQYATAFNADGSVKTWSPMYVGDNLKEGFAYTALTGNKETDIKNNEVKAGKLFYDESVLGEDPQYKNTKFVYVPQENTPNGGAVNNGNYRIRIGFYKTAEDEGATDYTAVDDVHLHYNGKSPFTLQDDWDSKAFGDAIDSQTSPSIPVWLKRKFYADKWNTLVLPVSVSVSQLRAIFGSNVEVATPYGLDDDDPYLIRFTPVKLTGGNAIEAGKYYIVKPEKLNGTTSVMSVDATNGTATVNKIQDGESGTLFYDLGTHDIRSLAKADVAEMDINTFNYQSLHHKTDHNSIRIKGSYFNGTAPARSYVFTSQGRMLHLKTESLMKGYRFYIYDVDEDKQQSQSSKSFTMGSLSKDLDALLDSYNKKDDHATGIVDVNTSDNVNHPQSGNNDVYDLSGRRVAINGNMDTLPRGVYIINGKKYIKK